MALLSTFGSSSRRGFLIGIIDENQSWRDECYGLGGTLANITQAKKASMAFLTTQ
jgi:hypothetical protein